MTDRAISGLLAAALISIGAVAPMWAETDRPSRPFQQTESPCAVAAEVRAPGVVLLGARTGVTIGARTVCAGELLGLDIALVVDGSGATAGSVNVELKRIGRDLVGALYRDDQTRVRTAVIEYRNDTNVLCDFTSDPARLISCVNLVGAVGDADTLGAVDRGFDLLESVAEPGRVRALVLLTGSSVPDCQPLADRVASARNQGALGFAACHGPRCDSTCLTQAFGPGHHTANPALISEDLHALTVLQDVTASSMVITASLASALAPIDGSLEPPGRIDGQSVVWQIPSGKLSRPGGGRAGTVVAFDVRPVSAGSLTQPVKAQLLFTDTLGRRGTFSMSLPSMAVVQPTVVPPSYRVYMPWTEAR